MKSPTTGRALFFDELRLQIQVQNQSARLVGDDGRTGGSFGYREFLVAVHWQGTVWLMPRGLTLVSQAGSGEARSRTAVLLRRYRQLWDELKANRTAVTGPQAFLLLEIQLRRFWASLAAWLDQLSLLRNHMTAAWVRQELRAVWSWLTFDECLAVWVWLSGRGPVNPWYFPELMAWLVTQDQARFRWIGLAS